MSSRWAGYAVFVSLSILYYGYRAYRRSKYTKLRGPPRRSYLYGYAKVLQQAFDQAPVLEGWSKEYGLVYNLPSPLGKNKVIVMDPKALAYICNNDTYGFRQTALARQNFEIMTGRGILWAEGDSHKRQRKTLTPGFSNVAIRNMTPIFFDSAYKVVAAWDAQLESQSQVVIDIQDWMNRVSLDSIGLAGFSYDFGTLRHQPFKLGALFEELGNLKPTMLGMLSFMLAPSFPLLAHLPTERNRVLHHFKAAAGEIADVLMSRSIVDGELSEMKPLTDKDDKSVLSLLAKSYQATSPGMRVTKEEFSAQIRLLILAGYVTTSLSLTWGLIELARHPEDQSRLREELKREFPNGDPTWDQLTHSLPFLDGVVHEILRLHPSVMQTNREAHDDAVVPLSVPVTTAGGEVVDHIHLPRGTVLTLSTTALNQAEAVWGPDAKLFNPARWLEGSTNVPERAKEVQGYRHLLTFIDGPRVCLGKNFAIAEFKAVLCVLVKNYVFEMRDGLDTKLDKHLGLLFRPKVAGEKGDELPMIVRKVE